MPWSELILKKLKTESGARIRKSWSDGKLVFVDGSDGQVVTLGLEPSFIGNPGQSKFLAFGRDPVRRSFVGVSSAGFVRVFSVRVLAVAGLSGQLLLGLRLFSSGAIRSGVTAMFTVRLLIVSCRVERELTSIGCCHPNCGRRTG